MKPISIFFIHGYKCCSVIASSLSSRIRYLPLGPGQKIILLGMHLPRWVPSWHRDADKPSFPCPPTPSRIHSRYQAGSWLQWNAAMPNTAVAIPLCGSGHKWLPLDYAGWSVEDHEIKRLRLTLQFLSSFLSQIHKPQFFHHPSINNFSDTHTHTLSLLDTHILEKILLF